MTSVKALVVEDDPAMAAAVVRGLKAAGFEVELVVTGPDAIRRLLAERVDVVVLDLNLPGADGLEVLTRVRHLGATPVIVVSARPGLGDRLAAFEAGASDFLPKPFWLEELVVRIRRLTKTDERREHTSLRFAELEIDLDARVARIEGQLLALTPNELSVLTYLATRPGRAISRATLAEWALASEDEPDARTIDSHVARLRKKLGAHGARIATVWGIGYRFDDGALS